MIIIFDDAVKNQIEGNYTEIYSLYPSQIFDKWFLEDSCLQNPAYASVHSILANCERYEVKGYEFFTTKEELKAWITEQGLQEHFDLRKSFENLVIDVKNYFSEE